jgi:hypothetical protein
MANNKKTKVTARSTYGDRFFEFVVTGEKNTLEGIMLALSAERKRAGYTGEMLTDVMFTNFVLIYSSSLLNVTPINLPANSFSFGKIKTYESREDEDSELTTYTFDVCLRGEGESEQEAWEDAVNAFSLDPGCP